VVAVTDGGPADGVDDDAGSQRRGEPGGDLAGIADGGTYLATAQADTAIRTVYRAVHGPWPGAASANFTVRARAPGPSATQVTNGGPPRHKP